jgi:ABC-type lipoprotein export system ATPase subunit
MIRINGLTFQYPGADFHLQVPAFQVQAGEKVAVIGPSGSGKTTLLNLLAGILVPDSGTIQVNEHNVSGLTDAGRRNFRVSNIGFVFQEFELIDYLNVLDNILHPYRITRSLKLTPEVRAHAVSLAESMEIGAKLNRAINRLSQGEKQRVAICRALLPAPGLILADEATGNLDPRNKGQILDLLFRSVADRGATLLAVTHDHELLPRFDRVIDFRDFRQEAA